MICGRLSSHILSRNRLPSLYSDFTLQKKTNPDGYAVNIAAWEQALNRAAKRGYTSSRGIRVRSDSTTSQKNGTLRRKKTDHLILRTDESLLRELELPEWGRPVALGAVFVCGSSGTYKHLESTLLTECIGRSDAKTDYDPVANIQD